MDNTSKKKIYCINIDGDYGELWLEKFAHTAYMRAGLNFFLTEEKYQTKNLNTKNKDLIGD